MPKYLLNWTVLLIAILLFRAFPDLWERYQETIVAAAGGLVWYYHSRPRVAAHLRISGRSLPMIDVENTGNRLAQNVRVELLPKEFTGERSDRISREQPIGDMAPGYTRQITVPKNWPSIFNNDLEELEDGRKNWQITVHWTSKWVLFSTPHSQTTVTSLMKDTLMNDRTLDDKKKTNDHLESIHKDARRIGDEVAKLARLEGERIHGDVLYLRAGQIIHMMSGPEFAPSLNGEQAKELIEALDSIRNSDDSPQAKYTEEITDRLKFSGYRQFFQWGLGPPEDGHSGT